MDSVLDQIGEWLKELLVSGIMNQLTGLFDSVNTQVGDIATQVGTTPANFSPGVFAMIRNVSESVIIPVAGLILTFIACYELIQMIIDHNNLANFETWIFFKWVFKTFVAVTLITNTFNIVMAVFDVTQHVINNAGGLIAGNTAVDAAALETMQDTLEAMEIGPLFALFLQCMVVQFTIKALSVVIFVIVYGRMIEIYLMTSMAPIPFSTFGNREQSMVGQNYLRSLFALGFQGFLIMICVGIYAVLIQSVSVSDDIIGSIWGILGYTVLLCFTLFKTGALAKAYSRHTKEGGSVNSGSLYPCPSRSYEVKSKILFNLTKRQLLCFGAGALIGVPSFFLLKAGGNTSMASICMIIIMLPFFFLGMYERDGQPLEKIAKQFIQAKFVRPKVRPYQTNNYYAVLIRQAQAEMEVNHIVYGEKSVPKNRKRNLNMPKNLTKAQARQVQEIIDRARRDDGIPRTAQQSIPLQRMFPDGICRVSDKYYTKTIQYQDINYQLAQQEDKTAIFEEWCSFLNFFDSSIHFELSFMNMATDAEVFEKNIRIPYRNDSFNNVRSEYSQMLKMQLAQGNNGLTKTKYITFGIEAESMREAKPRLEHVQTNLMNNFKRLGVSARVLNGKERLQLMHAMFHMGDNDRFYFDWSWLAGSGLSVKDFIAPTSFSFPGGKTFTMGSLYGAMSYLQITASDLSDQLLKDFLDMESSEIVTMHIQSVDQTTAIKQIKHTITELDRSKIEEQKKAVRSGYDMDIIPSDLATYGKDAKALLKELQSQNERMFLITFLIMNTGKTQQELENNVFQASSIAQKHNCNLRRLDFQQEQGLMSSLPLANNLIEIQRALTTSSTAIFIPFTTQELFQNGDEALYYGLNALSNNLIMVDRKKLKNPNGLILGTPGSGKSFSAKREITNAFLVTDDDIIICDPEAEYTALVNCLEGQVIKISPTSTHYINPMDINESYSEDDNPLALKADFILSLCELIVGGKEGLQPIEKTVIDRCVHQIYQHYFEDPKPENMPLLEDLYNALLQQEEKEAHRVATALEIYVKGSLNLFNHRTNVDIRNRFVCYDIKELGKQLKKLGMLIVQDQVWGRVTANRSAGKTTRYYMDEFHLLLKEEQTASYSVEIWKRFRKWGGIPTGITQNVKDLLSSREVENIFENSDFVYMLNQAAGDRQILAQQLNISPHQLSYVTHSGEGEGLLFYGNVILPFVDHFPTDLELYRIMTTKLSEVAEAKAV